MFRSLVLGLAALALIVGGIVAEEHKGKLKKIDTSAKKLTIETKDGEKTVDYSDSLKIVGKDKEGKDTDIDVSKARLNRPAEATIQRARQEEVRRLLGVMTQLSSRADADPLNAEVREQLAQTSEQLGRNDWARSWRETSKASLQLRTNPP
jgi:uncharacterized protein YjlB